MSTSAYSSSEYLQTDNIGQERRRRRRKKKSTDKYDAPNVEKHWRKLLQANEPNANFLVRQCLCGKAYCHSQYARHMTRRPHRSMSTSVSDGFLTNMFRKFFTWVSPKRTRIPSVSSSIQSEESDATSEDVWFGGGSYSDTNYECGARYPCRALEFGRPPCDVNRKPPLQISQSVDETAMAKSLQFEMYCQSMFSSGSGCSRASSTEVFENETNVPSIVVTEAIDTCNDFLKYVDLEQKPSVVHETKCQRENMRKENGLSRNSTAEKREVQDFSVTWPPPGTAWEDTGNDINYTDDLIEFSSAVDSRTIADFTIPHCDIELGEEIRSGHVCTIYRGRWHGDAIVHYYGTLNADDEATFWRDVETLTRIRHENIALFAGASVEPNHLAIVTSIQNRESLYNQIHIKQERMSYNHCVRLLRQISQGMGYLHAKGIVIKQLSSRNIFLCPKVKLSVLDCGMPEAKYSRSDYATIPRGHLTYLSPELLRTICVVPPHLICLGEFTFGSDIYAFGTVLYELMCGRYPLLSYQPETVIWMVCSGSMELDSTELKREIKCLLEHCWTLEASERPSFVDIDKDLHEKIGPGAGIGARSSGASLAFPPILCFSQKAKITTSKRNLPQKTQFFGTRKFEQSRCSLSSNMNITSGKLGNHRRMIEL